MFGFLKRKKVNLEPIRKARIETVPFPHFFCDNILPKRIFNEILKEWPSRSQFRHEPEHDRYWMNLVRATQAEATKDFWQELKKNVLNPIQTEVANKLLPYYGKRFGDGDALLEPVFLQLHQAGEHFTEHKPHTHFVHNPEYAFTTLLYLDDDGASERGTAFYHSYTHEEFVKADIAGLSAYNHKASAISVPFKPNRLVVFVDSFLSVHGTMPFDPACKTGSRKLIHSHVKASGDYLNRKFGQSMPAEQLIEEFQKLERKEKIDDSVYNLLMSEQKVVQGWSHPTATNARASFFSDF